jgi:hypothetical protein
VTPDVPLRIVGAFEVPTELGLGVGHDFDRLERHAADAIRGACLDDARPRWFSTKRSL